MTAYANLALVKQNIIPTRLRSSKKYTDLTMINRRIFDLSPSIKYLKSLKAKSADIRLANEFYYDY